MPQKRAVSVALFPCVRSVRPLAPAIPIKACAKTTTTAKQEHAAWAKGSAYRAVGGAGTAPRNQNGTSAFCVPSFMVHGLSERTLFHPVPIENAAPHRAPHHARWRPLAYPTDTNPPTYLTLLGYIGTSGGRDPGVGTCPRTARAAFSVLSCLSLSHLQVFFEVGKGVGVPPPPPPPPQIRFEPLPPSKSRA